MKDAVGKLIPHRYTGGGKCLENLLIACVSGISSWVDQNSNRNTLLEPVYDFLRDRGILHEPESDIDSDGFLVYQSPKRRSAVLVRGVA